MFSLFIFQKIVIARMLFVGWVRYARVSYSRFYGVIRLGAVAYVLRTLKHSERQTGKEVPRAQ